MLLVPGGIHLTDCESRCLHHQEEDIEKWLLELLQNKIKARKDALVVEWQPRLLKDPSITTLSASQNEICEIILAHPSYVSRYDSEVALQAQGRSSSLDETSRRLSNNTRVSTGMSCHYMTAKYNSTVRQGGQVIFPNGIEIGDLDAACLQAYLVDIEDWVYGALLGQINRGKKKMITQYQQVLFDDPTVMTIPATEEGLIECICARADYKTIPAQLARSNHG